MTTPTILSDAAASQDAKVDRSGAVRSQKASATIPASTAADTIIGLIRFEKGFELDQLAVNSDDLDSATNVTLDVGYVYDDNSTFTNDPDAFLDGSDIVQDAGSIVWPVADGLLTGEGFVAEGPGYIVAQIKGASTTTEGDIDAKALFSYDGS